MKLTAVRFEKQASPALPKVERRRHRLFRIFFIDFGAFLERFILRKPKAAAKRDEEPELPLSAFMEQPAPGMAVQPGPKPQPKIPFPILGIDAIDRQHEQFLGAMQGLQKAVASGGREAHGAGEVLGSHAEDHFAYEEAYMAKIQYPDLARHQQDHDYFRGQLKRLRQHSAAGDTFAAMEISASLFHWLQDHILREDRAYALHARQAS